MRSRGLTPRALSALATRLVLISNSAKLVRRPSNSNALALPRLFARARTISARFAGSPEADMFLPFAYFSLCGAWRHPAPKTISQRRPAFAGTTRLPPRGAVLFVLRLDRVARLGPVRVGPVAQLIEVAAHRQRLAAVHRDGLAVDPVAAAGNQEYRQILQLLHGADPAHWIHRLGAGAGFVAGLDALAHAFGGDFARRDRVQPDAVSAPFSRERHGHGMHRRLAHRRRHHVRRAVADPGHGDRHHIAALLGGDPAPPDGVRDIERAMHDDVGHRVEAARAQLLGARDEIAGGVVDEIGEGTFAEDVFHHLVDRERVSDIDAVAGHAAAMEVHELGRGLVADDLAAAADVDVRAKLKKTRGHGFAEPSATSGYEDAPAGQEIFIEHGCFRLKGLSVNW